jgi:hypothetical protein
LKIQKTGTKDLKTINKTKLENKTKTITEKYLNNTADEELI